MRKQTLVPFHALLLFLAAPVSVHSLQLQARSSMHACTSGDGEEEYRVGPPRLFELAGRNERLEYW
jgi:hypothetical protein